MWLRSYVRLSSVPAISLMGPLMAFMMAMLGHFDPVRAQAIETEAKQALLVDLTTGTVLLDKASSERMYPSSMTKLMTAYILMQRVKDGSLSLEAELPISEKAWRKGGSKMFVEVGKRVSVADLLRGIIVQSGNDATIVVAEGLSGSEKAFAEEMTSVAREMGMLGTQFRNASGWPDPEHFTTAADLAILAKRIIEDFPDLYSIYSETEFTYNDIKQRNRNPLLYRNIGADGLKTGHTQAAGYGLTASAVQDGRRLILVVNGLTSSRARAEEAERLMQWGFREWNTYRLFKAGDRVTEIPVWLGEEAVTPVAVQDDVTVAIRRRARDSLSVSVRYDDPVPAPISVGQTVGSLVVKAPGLETLELPLVAVQAVEQLGPVGRVSAAINHLIWGEAGSASDPSQ